MPTLKVVPKDTFYIHYRKCNGLVQESKKWVPTIGLQNPIQNNHFQTNCTLPLAYIEMEI